MSYFLPEELYYSQNHEWLQVDENLVTVGLTEYAVEHLGEILYLELPDEGQHANLGTSFCSLESILKIHDIACPVNGTVLEINTSLIDDPTPLNDDPFGEGWLLRIEMDNERELATFLRSREYRTYVEGLKK
ncbi:MAG: glycine cleavage system protein GcvH [Pseudobdellovibrionaceae bacterium]